MKTSFKSSTERGAPLSLREVGAIRLTSTWLETAKFLNQSATNMIDFFYTLLVYVMGYLLSRLVAKWLDID